MISNVCSSLKKDLTQQKTTVAPQKERHYLPRCKNQKGYSYNSDGLIRGLFWNEFTKGMYHNHIFMTSDSHGSVCSYVYLLWSKSMDDLVNLVYFLHDSVSFIIERKSKWTKIHHREPSENVLSDHCLWRHKHRKNSLSVKRLKRDIVALDLC